MTARTRYVAQCTGAHPGDSTVDKAYWAARKGKYVTHGGGFVDDISEAQVLGRNTIGWENSLHYKIIPVRIVHLGDTLYDRETY